MTTAEIGVFGGSGFYSFLEDTETVEIDTPYGAAQRAGDLGEVGGRTGGVHPPARPEARVPAAPVPYQANVWAMKELGVSRVLGPNACGSLQADVKPGEFVICDQLVDRTRDRANTFYDGPVTTHISFADPYCPTMRDGGDRAGTRPRHPAARPRHRRGDRGTAVLHARRIHLVRRRRLGGHQHDPVPRGDPRPRAGALLHEHLAHHRLRRRRARACAPVTHEEVVRVFTENNEKLRDLLFAVIPALPDERDCPCATALTGARFEA